MAFRIFKPKKYHLGMTGDEVKASLQGTRFITIALTDEELEDLGNTPVVKDFPTITDFSIEKLNSIIILLNQAGQGSVILRLQGVVPGIGAWGSIAITQSATNYASSMMATYLSDLPGKITISKVSASH